VNLGHTEESPHEPLAVPDPLGHESASRHIEKGRLALRGHSFRKHGLAVTWRTVQKNSSGRRSDPREDLRPQLRVNNVLNKSILNCFEPLYVLKLDLGSTINNRLLDLLHHLLV
jgi:hypothetical protein